MVETDNIKTGLFLDYTRINRRAYMSEQISLSCSSSKNETVISDSIHVHRVALSQSIHFVPGKILGADFVICSSRVTSRSNTFWHDLYLKVPTTANSASAQGTFFNIPSENCYLVE